MESNVFIYVYLKYYFLYFLLYIYLSIFIIIILKYIYPRYVIKKKTNRHLNEICI